MRLLSAHRIHYRLGGAEAVHLDHLALFRERGWDCAEFAMQHPQNEPSDFAAYFPSFFDPAAARGTERISAVARFLYSREVRKKFNALIDDFRPDVIHVHGTYYQLTDAIFSIAKARGIPSVFTLHDYKPLCPAHHLFREEVGICEDCKGGHQYMCAVNRCLHGSRSVSAVYALEGLIQWYRGAIRDAASLFVGPSRFINDKFVEWGYPRDKMRYVPNFFQTTDDRPVPPERIDALRAQHGKFILCFGRLSVEKGLSDLIAATKAAGARLVLAGRGPEEAKLRAEAAASAADVVFTGHLTGADLWAHVEAAHAVALPSIWFENAPKALLEAQARGKLVITTATGGLPELVADGETGFVVPMNDVPALTGAIAKTLAMDEAQLLRIGDTARRRVLADFSRERYFTEMTAIYDEVLAKPALAVATSPA